MSWKHLDFGTNEGGVQNVVSVNDDGELVARDVQHGAVVQKILDSCAQARNEYDHLSPNREAYGYIAARIPITLWQNWRREWAAKYRQYWTWQTFEAMKLNSRDYSYLRTTDDKIHVPRNVQGL